MRVGIALLSEGFFFGTKYRLTVVQGIIRFKINKKY
ncbi:MAG: hypothetical protein ACI82Z_001586 [Cellvibrionaceae bacterium]|jgi:hypothetical protein